MSCERSNARSWGVFLSVIAVFWLVFFAAKNALIATVHSDSRYAHVDVSQSAASLMLIKAMAVVTLAAFILWLGYLNGEWLRRKAEEGFFSIVMVAGISATILAALIYVRESGYFGVLDMVEHPERSPVSGHRLLLIWPAQILHRLLPSVTALHLLLATQTLAALFTSLVIGFWSAAFIGRRLAFLGQLFLLAFLFPTFICDNFYDVAIVGFYAATFLAVIRHRFWITVPLIAVATLNHENALLLVPAVGFAAALSEPRWKWIAVTGSALAAHLAVRMALWYYMPMPRAFDMRIYSNAVWLATFAPLTMSAFAVLIFRWFCGYMGWKYAPPVLKRLAVFWPFLFLVTILCGQFYEIRQFDADIPLVIALLLLYIRKCIAEHSDDLVGDSVYSGA